jgi:hypothetical protein
MFSLREQKKKRGHREKVNLPFLAQCLCNIKPTTVSVAVTRNAISAMVVLIVHEVEGGVVLASPSARAARPVGYSMLAGAEV